MKILLAFVATLLLLDYFLPPDRMDTTTYTSTFSATSGGVIVYGLPLTGGGMASCNVSAEMVREIPERSEVVVASSAIFGRCTGVYPFAEPQGIDRARFVETAIRHAFNDVYASLDELRADYPGFTPRIRFWGSDPWYQPASWRRYSVQLPDELVILDSAGVVRTTRSCGSSEGDCEVVAPAHTERGIVGTVQSGAPDYAVLEDYVLAWPGHATAALFQSGHCFSAYSNQATRQNPTLRIKGGEAMPIRVGYGFFLVVHKGEGFGAMRISRALFKQSQSCRPEVRAQWANAGGYGWRR